MRMISEDHAGRRVRLRRVAWHAVFAAVGDADHARVRSELLRKWVPVVALVSVLVGAVLWIAVEIVAHHGL
ncbi:MAG: hypothetical protein AAF108_11070, partial [Planctomycetota bacterium]